MKLIKIKNIKNRTLIFGTALGILLVSPQGMIRPTVVHAATVASYQVNITTSALNIRTSPSTSGAIVGQYYLGNTVTVIGQSGDWLQTAKGYISAKYTSSASYQATITASSLNIRQAPSTSAQTLGTYSKGTVVTVIGQSGDWLQTAKGYIFASYTQKVGVSSTTSTTSTASRGSNISVTGAQLVAIAERYLGVPYVYGGASPSGFDCSGLVQYVHNLAGISIPRVAVDQSKGGVAVSKANLKPGDLVFFGSPVSHVGIYIGNDQFINAPKTGDVVKISTLSTRTDYNCARRYY
jgi:cell wall-associated NlpC family hydrolase